MDEFACVNSAAFGNNGLEAKTFGGLTMKRYLAFALTLVLTAALFAGCGCTAGDAEYTTVPTTMPTVMTTAPTETTRATESTTHAATERDHTETRESTATATESTTETGTDSRTLSPTTK